ncbi:MAG: O-antigen ligase family protein [Candidatus Curtissbacteria bacterium]|nr:O-antigen ligase family protein [Candidatus Curtissbacteria bacterium]
MDSKTAFWDKLIYLTFLASAIVTPLIFTTAGTELFEVPKMFIVYLTAVILLTSTALKFVFQGKIQIPRSLVFYSLLVLVAVQILSTLTSIDKFTSVFGYPTRLNGGLLSQFAYLIIFTAAIINLNFQKAQKLLLTMTAAAFVVALWGIPGHFGFDPNCLVLTGRLNAACWQKEFDPTIRIFSTLGQPNWLASFMVIAVPLSLSLLLISKKGSRRFPFLLSFILILALIFTKSLSGMLGLFISLFVFLTLIGSKLIRKNLKILSVAAVIFLATLAFFYPTIKGRITDCLDKTPKPNAGTSSCQIRLVTWEGAIRAFKARPLLGFGPETFVYSYYQFRPQAANATTEWNFYYNKAHNEFLNYAANTGILGFGAYLTFLAACLFELFKISKDKSTTGVWAKATIASIIGYQAAISVGFSIVTTQLFMFCQIAAVLVMAGPKIKTVDLKNISIIRIIEQKQSAKRLASFLTATLGFWLLIFVLRLYFADILINRARSLGRLTAYDSAVSVIPAQNPFYFADYSYILAVYAASQKDARPPTTDAVGAVGQAKLTDILTNDAISYGTKALEISPNNLLVLRKVKTAYDELGAQNPLYKIKDLELAQKETILAPTDPTSFLDLAKAQLDLGKQEDAINSLKTSIKLKPDYQEARDLLDQIQDKKLQ